MINYNYHLPGKGKDVEYIPHHGEIMTSFILFDPFSFPVLNLINSLKRNGKQMMVK